MLPIGIEIIQGVAAMKSWIAGLLCLALSTSAFGIERSAARKLVVASVLVTGSITVAPDGSVKNYVVDDAGKLPAPVISLIAKNAATWRFEPVVRDGQPVIAKAAMSLRIVASPVDDSHFSMSIVGSHFGQPASFQDPTGTSISSATRSSPQYPMEAARARVSGTVYLIMRVNRAGLVDEDAAEQVNLDFVASDSEMLRWRNVLANAAVRASRRWTFTPPTAGPGAEQSSWMVRVPVVFKLWGQSRPSEKYGDWHVYVPGPRTIPEWAGKPAIESSADAVAAGGVSEVGGGLRLTTPLNGM